MPTKPLEIARNSNMAEYIRQAAEETGLTNRELELVIELVPSIPYEVAKHLYFAVNHCHKITQWLDRTGIPEYHQEYLPINRG